MTILPLTSAGLSHSEEKLIDELMDRLSYFAGPNFEANAYYEAKHLLTFPGVTIPQDVASRLSPVTGTPATVVDVLDERLDFLGWDEVGSSSLGLKAVYDDNELDAEAPMLHLDCLIFGTAFGRVGTGGERDTPLVTMHPPTTTTGLRDSATRRLRAAWALVEPEDGEAMRAVLDLPDEAITVAKRAEGERWRVVDRDQHRLGRVPVVQFTNRPRTSRRGGRSEITPAIRSLTEDMMRASIGMSVNTMFYSIPQLMILGRGPDAFKDRAGNPIPGWKILAGHALAIDKDDAGDTPTIEQLSIASPQPFIEQLREFRMQVASEAGLPAEYLGISVSRPPSGDAIRMAESRLVKRTERRQSGFGRSWLEIARLALLVRDGSVPDEFESRVAIDWQSAATPTRAATADEVTKLVGAGILRPDSAVVRKRLGLSRAELRLLEDEQRTQRGADLLSAVRQAAATPALTEPVTDVNGG